MAGQARKNRPSIYRLKATIRGIRPPVWRRPQVSGAATFGELHDVLQTAFGWEDDHLHHFAVGDTFYGLPDPEDCGGAWGDARLIEATGDPEHPEYEEMREWLGENFDPEWFGLEEVNVLLRAG